MTVSQLIKTLSEAKDQEAVVKVDGHSITGIQTAYGNTLVRILKNPVA